MSRNAWAQEGRQPKIAIIGSGMSGIAAVIKLRKAGYTDTTVFEKSDNVGGTWRDNRYPGLSCDVPSHWYSFTFARNPNWSHKYAYGPEIQAYMEKTARDFDVMSCVRFNEPVTSLTYEEPFWHLKTEQSEDVYDVVISAAGILRIPNFPDIKGLETFEGDCFHSARWNDKQDLSGKRVGIIGTGSTAAQIIGEITPKVGHMSVFQRTPQWIAPLPQRKYKNIEITLFKLFPFLLVLSYWMKYITFRFTFGPATTGNKRMQRMISRICTEHLETEITDPELRAKLTPPYQAACKRLIFASDFYPAIRSQNCSLITEGIDSITPKGVMTVDGKLHELDVLILATGFDASAFILPTKVLGEGGLDLADFWKGAPRAHRGVSVPGFPNFWMLEGPTSPIGNLSLIMISEHQVDYIISMLNEMKKKQLSSMSPKISAYKEYNEKMIERVKDTVWVTGGCDSWYIDDAGHPNLYPFPPQMYLKEMHRPNLNEYEARPLSNRHAAE